MRHLIYTGIVLVLLALAFAAGRLSLQPGHLSGEGPVDGVREALATGGALTRIARLGPALQSLDTLDIEPVASLYAREISTLGECDIAPFVDAWTSLDVEAALAGVAAWPYPLKRQIGLQQAVQAVAAKDAPRAAILYERLAERYPRLRAGLQDSLVTGWAASDPSGLRGYLVGLPAEAIGPPLGVALGMIARQHGVEALLTWSGELIEQAPGPLLRAKILRKTARTAARRDPHRAAAWVIGQWGRDYAEPGPAAVAEAWILVDPLDAIEWVQTAAPPESRSKAIELAFGRWLYENRSAAGSWLSSVERTAFHDPAVSAYARKIARGAPLEAIGWCEGVIGSETRNQCLVSVVRGWFQRDSSAAAEWLEQSPLDEETRALVREWAAKKKRRRAPPGQSARASAEGL